MPGGNAGLEAEEAAQDLPNPRSSMKDTFDDTFGPDSSNFRGYDEANDYDREMEKPENMKWDDEDWKGYQKSFTELEKEALNSNLKESELVKQIGEATLGEEIRRAVDGKAGI